MLTASFQGLSLVWMINSNLDLSMDQLVHETQIWLLQGTRMENTLTRATVFLKRQETAKPGRNEENVETVDPKKLEFPRSLRPGEGRTGALVQAGERACLQKGLPQSTKI